MSEQMAGTNTAEGPRTIAFGVIGCGLMGREFASAAARWCHLLDQDVQPRIVAVCDANPAAMTWFTQAIPGVRTYTDYHEMLADGEVEAVYCAVPHNLHRDIYSDILRAGKHLLGEKPFGIDREAFEAVQVEIERRPDLLVRCSSEYPFFPARCGCMTGYARGVSGASSKWKRATGIAAISIRISRSTGSGASLRVASMAAWVTWACTRCTCRCAWAGSRGMCERC